jgi:hypothetical protein
MLVSFGWATNNNNNNKRESANEKMSINVSTKDPTVIFLHLANIQACTR